MDMTVFMNFIDGDVAVDRGKERTRSRVSARNETMKTGNERIKKTIISRL